MATENRNYTEIPANVSPDVPFWVNQSLAEIDTDVEGLEALVESTRWQPGVLGPVNEFKHVDSMEDGFTPVYSGSNATAVGLPEASDGTVFQDTYGTAGLQLFLTTTGHIWQRKRAASAWGTTWERIDGGKDIFLGILGTAANHPYHHVDECPNGFVTVWSGSQALEVGLPTSSLGVVFTGNFGNAGLQVWLTTNGQIWMRPKGGEFIRVDAGAVVQGNTSGNSPASGFKLVPLSLTAGQPTSSAPARGSYRILEKWNAPIVRWRAHVTNRSVRHGDTVGSGMTLESFYVGAHGANGAFAGTPSRFAVNATIPDDGSEWISGWRTEEIPQNQEVIFSFDYDSVVAPVRAVAGGWFSDLKTAGQVAPAGLSKVNSVAFDIWIEAETYAGTPVIAQLGDSLSIAAAATMALYDSTLSLYCRKMQALPVHYGVSSDSLSSWIDDPNEYKVQRWANLAQPDACLLTHGHNDDYGLDLPLSTMQANVLAALPLIRAVISPNIYAATITPRNAGTAEEHAVRNAYNPWLKSLVQSGEVRQVFDFDQVITGGTDTILPEYNADGIHFTTLGYQAQADAIDRPLTSPAIQYVI